MKTWTFNCALYNLLDQGLYLKDDSRLGSRVLILGEKTKDGKSGHFEVVGLGRQNPANISSQGIVWEARLQGIPLDTKARRRTIYYLCDCKKKKKGALVHIKTRCEITCANGQWFTEAGNPKTLVDGHGCRQDPAGMPIRRWKEGLVVMHPGDVICVHGEDGQRYALICHDNDLLDWQDIDSWRQNQRGKKAAGRNTGGRKNRD